MSFTGRAGKGPPLLGAYLAIESAYSAHVMGRAGFDWLLIDMEHSPLSARDATAMVHAVAVGSRGTCASLIRIPALGVEWVKWALDSGAAGVVAPMVQTKAEAEQLVRFAAYPPLGQRSFGPFNAPWADLSPDSSMAKYFSTTSKDVAIIVMIESLAGVNEADAIMATTGIGGVFVGPVDLRLSMGLQGADGQEPEYVQALEKIVRIGKRVGIPVGIFSASPESLKVHLAMGFSFVLVSRDAMALTNGVQSAMDVSRQVVRELKL